MKIKVINFFTALIIYFAIAWIIEFTIGWGSQNKWLIIITWSVTMALAEIFLFQPFKRYLQNKNKKAKNK